HFSARAQRAPGRRDEGAPHTPGSRAARARHSAAAGAVTVRLPATGCRLPAAGYRLPATGCQADEIPTDPLRRLRRRPRTEGPALAGRDSGGLKPAPAT